MRVIKRLPLQRFWEAHRAAEAPLREWYRLARKAKWRDFPALRRTFGQTDRVPVKSGGQVEVFDIGGNKFRLVGKVSYNKSKIYVLRVMTHKEYSKMKWVDEL